MLKLYCQKCGALNGYVSEKPNFCQKCGTSFNLQASGNISETEERQEELETEGDDDTPSLFKLEGLDVEIDSGKSFTEKLGDIAGSISEEEAMGNIKDSSNDQKGQLSYTIEDFKKEAGEQRGRNGPEET